MSGEFDVEQAKVPYHTSFFPNPPVIDENKITEVVARYLADGWEFFSRHDGIGANIRGNFFSLLTFRRRRRSWN